MGVGYNRNTGLAVDADLELFVVDADVSVRTRSCSDWRDARREVAQTRLRHEVT